MKLLLISQALPEEVYQGSLKANGREPESCFGRVFNFKLGCFTKCVQFMA